jgi:hypothetical protein
MERLHIEPTRDTPEVLFRPTAKVLRMAGNSYPNNALDFYEPLLDWFQQLLTVPELDELTLEFLFNYINTASLKMIIRMLETFEDWEQTGKKAKVIWKYDKDDVNILEQGHQLKDHVQLGFELIPID